VASRYLLVLCLLVPFQVAVVAFRPHPAFFRLAVAQVVAAGFRHLRVCFPRHPVVVLVVVFRRRPP
jgi:hypothetical protein